MAERHADVRFEPTDVRVGPVVWFLVALSAALATVMAVLWFTQKAELKYHHDWAVSDPTTVPEPRIEGLGLDTASHSVTNFELANSARSQRLREDKMLAEGWTDSAGKRHAPINEAFKKLIEEAKKNRR